MAIPKYYELYKPYLELLMDGEAHKTKELKKSIIDYFNLTEAEANEMLPSNNQSKLDNRIGWCKTHLKHALLVETPSRFEVEITDRGRAVYEKNSEINDAVLCMFPEFCDFVGKRASKVTDSQTTKNREDLESAETPQETMQRVHDQMNNELADEVLSMVLPQSPSYFEWMVVKLLEKMGYCKELNGKGITTQATSDGGIDGIIYQDRLGFDKIYIQAKKWDPKSSIQRPELQKFYGAMAGQHAQKGLFITTTTFSKGAVDYANGQNIVLVDGYNLAKLMIEYELGVTTEYTYKIKRIDSDFFSEEF